MSSHAERYLSESPPRRGVSGWHRLYLDLLRHDPEIEVLVAGAGAPDFLQMVPARRRVALDVSDLFRAEFEAAGIMFHRADLERDAVDGLGRFDVVVCSDVFEHLLSPGTALAKLAGVLRPEGVLLAHVPNEFRLRHLVKVMLGRDDSLCFHRHQEEWTDPHLRRFTERGFGKFLSTTFRFNLKIHDLRYSRQNRLLERIFGSVPYCLQPGPAFVSSNSKAAYDRYCRVKQMLATRSA